MPTVTPELLSLWHTPGVGPQRLRRLMDRFGSAAAIYAASPRQLCEVEGIDQSTAAKIRAAIDLETARRQLDQVRTAGVELISLWDAAYPALLAALFDPPILLFVRGEVATLAQKGVAVVGTRTPSEYGEMVTRKLTRELVQHGLVIVSGLARGVDTITAHEAITAGGRTVAVLGSGVDRIYPGENHRLAQQVTDHGALVSEYPLGTMADAPHFPRRNRIIAGLTVATLVVEAGDGSGALITADNALENNREVMAVPGNITNPRSWGCHRLIQQGAKLVQGVEDILVEIGMAGHEPQQLQLDLGRAGMSEQEAAVLAAVGAEPQHIDDIARKLGKPMAVVLAQLLQLELQGRVLQQAGKKFVRL